MGEDIDEEDEIEPEALLLEVVEELPAVAEVTDSQLGDDEDASSSDDEGATGVLRFKADDDDIPIQNHTISGATADPVKDYLKQIGKVALLNAEQEVDLAKSIEAGLFAEEKLATEKGLSPADRRDLSRVVKDGKRAKAHLLEANLRLVVSLCTRSMAALSRATRSVRPL